MSTAMKSKDEFPSPQKTGNIRALVADLGSDDGMTRVKARKQFVKMGPKAIDYLMELVYDSRQILRWEAIKALGDIGDPRATPLLIDALEDEDSEIRWLASKGLVHIGNPILKPLLETLLQKWDSAIFREGVHRALYFMHPEKLLLREKIEELLKALSDEEALEEVPLIARDILNRLKFHE